MADSKKPLVVTIARAVAWIGVLIVFWSMNVQWGDDADAGKGPPIQFKRYVVGAILLGLELNGGFIQGAMMTLFVCFVSIAASTVLALVAALARLSRNGPAFGVASFYISFFRGTPLLLQVLLIYLGLPQIGLVIDAVPSGIIALSLCYGAYMAEIFRAGILAIPRGQSEAGMSLGLRKAQVMQLIVLPQAMRLIVPPTGNQFIAMLKDSALVSIIGVNEVLWRAETSGRPRLNTLEAFIIAALLYWALTIIFSYFQQRLERRMARSDR